MTADLSTFGFVLTRNGFVFEPERLIDGRINLRNPFGIKYLQEHLAPAENGFVSQKTLFL